MKFDFGWGDSYLLRELLFEEIREMDLYYSNMEYGYADTNGFPYLEDQIKQYLRYYTGLSYSNVVITNGCSMAIIASLKEYFSLIQLFYKKIKNLYPIDTNG